MVVNELYYGRHEGSAPRGFPTAVVAEDAGITISDDIIAAALRNIYRRDFNPHTDIEPNLFNAIAHALGQALTDGAAQGGLPALANDPFIHALRHSTDVFSAFKVHRAQNDMAARLLDSNGNLKPFEQWREEVLPIADHQCHNWLQTEYNTAVLRARQAANWQQFQAEKDILPNLKWLPSTSPNPGADHQPFWNTILPVDHPFWDQHRPGDRWNCKCDLTSTDEPPTPVPSAHGGSPAGDNPQPGLKDNPGKTAEVFSDDHPYFPADCKHCAFYNPTIKARLATVITARVKDCNHCPYIDACIDRTEVEMIRNSRDAVREYFKEKTLAVNTSEGPKYEIELTYQAVKCITGKPHKFTYLRNTICYDLEEVMSKAEYLGWSPDIKDDTVRGHGDAKNWHYYRIILANEDSFVVVKERENGDMLFHAIQDADHFKPEKIQNPWRKR